MVDTNVLIAANGRDTHASATCAASAAKALLALSQSGVLLEDSAGEVFSEYKRYSNFNGQPGAGDRFFVWYLRNRFNVELVEQWDVAPLPLSLQAMDPSDHKWIAVYLAGSGEEIWNATDSDWAQHAAALIAADVVVREICR